MKTLVLAAVLTALAVQPRSNPAFDPAGKWTFSTLDDQGAAISGTMDIAGRPGAYTGTITSGPDRTLTITGLFTSPTGMIVLADLPDNGGVAVIKVSQGADGTLQAGWGPIRNVIPATVARAK
jgi:hypothetical protein